MNLMNYIKMIQVKKIKKRTSEYSECCGYTKS